MRLVGRLDGGGAPSWPCAKGSVKYERKQREKEKTHVSWSLKSIITHHYILGGGLNSRHLPKTHATTAGTQKNRISRHRQNPHHQQQITLCTAHSAHHSHWHHRVLTKPSAHCVERRKSIHPTAANHTVHSSYSSQHGKFKKRRNQNEMLNEIGTRWERDPSSASGNLSFFFCPNHRSLVKTRCFTTFPKFRAPVSAFF